MGGCCSDESEELNTSSGTENLSREISPQPLIRSFSSSEKYTLETFNPNSIDFIPRRKEVIDAKIIDVYDGDTFTILYQYGDIFLKTKIRVLGADTPEKVIRGENGETEIGKLEERAGEHVKNKVSELIMNKILKVKMNKFDKYGGRVNGVLFLPSSTGYNTLTDYLIGEKYAKPYSGGKKEKWIEEELNYILNN